MKRLEFFYDLASTYSYLAATQLPALQQRTGCEIAWRPMVLGAVFQQTGNVMPGANPVKLRYLLRDVQRWVERYQIPFRHPSRFPVNTIQALRLCLQAERHGRQPELALRCFRAYWAEDADLTDEATLRVLLDEVGLPPGELLAGCASPEVKEALRQNGEEAVRRGVFGAPAFFVGDELFWGNDRLDFVEERLRG